MKKSIIFLLSLILLGLLWYIFVKDFDYQFKFHAKYGTASVYKEIVEYKEPGDHNSILEINLINENPYQKLTQELLLKNGAIVHLDWVLKQVNDSVTKIVVNILEKNNTISNRVKILNPFSDSRSLNEIKLHLQEINKDLKFQQDFYKIKMASRAFNPGSHCACITSTSSVLKKASAMMATINQLHSYTAENKIELQGKPLLKVTNWDMEKDLITFDFCFPIPFKEGLKETGEIRIKKIESQNSLKAVFNGNYRISHLAWLDLYEKARREKIPVEALPLEIYYNNPGMGGNDKEWRADVYLPVRE